MRPEPAHVADPRDDARTLIRCEFLVAIDGEAFLETELEPVAAGDAIAGPVVKILVRDDGFDRDEIVVGRGFVGGQNVFVVEDVEALVLHRAMLKSDTATIMNTSRSYSRPNAISSQRMERLSESIA